MSGDPRNEDPADLDELAGEYVLGTLPATERAEVQRRLGNDRRLREAVDAWESRLFDLIELAEPRQPAPALWTRIERSVKVRKRSPSVQGRDSWWNLVALWRGLAGAGLVTTLALCALLWTQPTVESPSFLVVLVAPQNQAPGWVVQASNPSEIQLIPLGVAQVPADKALEFWTKGDGWQGPVSLGLVKPGKTLSVPLDRLPPLEPNQLFELTLENTGGSKTGAPTGPVQFIGRAVKVL